jgi:hypothetical protein
VKDIMLYLSMEILQKQDNVQCILHDKAPKYMCQQRRRKSGAREALPAMRPYDSRSFHLGTCSFLPELIFDRHPQISLDQQLP